MVASFHEPMAQALAQAFGDFHHNFSEEEINDAPRRLYRNKCFPAVIRVPTGTKTRKPVEVVVLRAQD